MSRRLANKARRVRRKRSRTGYHPTGVELEGAPPSPDPWSGVPESRRKVVSETLRGGVVRKTYVDTAEDVKAVPPQPTPSKPPPAPVELSRPPETRKGPASDSRFANYSMPGHEKPD